MGNTWHVDAACGHVGGHQNAHFAITHGTQGAVARALVHVAMQGGSGKAGQIEAFGEQIGIALGGGEHHALVDADVAQQMIEQAILVRQIVDKMQALGDVFVLGGGASDADHQRLAGDAIGHLTDHAVQRGREQQGLARGRRGGDDVLDVVDEAHVEHAVGFVEHQHFELREINLAGFHVVDQAARRGHEDLRIACQQLHLFGIRHAAEDGDGLDEAQLGTVFFCGGGDLQGQFACGRQHQHLGLGGLEAHALATALRRLALLIWRLAGFFGQAGTRGAGQFVDGRQHEGSRFARASLRRNHQVAAFQYGRDGLLLDVGGFRVARVGNGLQQGRVEVELRKFHDASFCRLRFTMCRMRTMCKKRADLAMQGWQLRYCACRCRHAGMHKAAAML